MILQTVRFESSLSEAEALRIAAERADAYRAVPGLLQKFYVKLDLPNHYAGVMLWESREALAAFRESELAKTVPTAYAVKGEPCVRLGEVFDVLRGGSALSSAQAGVRVAG
ncbi:MAG: antibiotic biosynthesis monooxygenase [Myxococcales bacterium]|nr:antibiotic biosynthesis monooxygenase [Myxococcales bacterium]